METTPNTFSDLFFGYSVIWLILVLYIWSLGKKIRRLEKQVKN